jgi:hypothetical protein
VSGLRLTTRGVLACLPPSNLPFGLMLEKPGLRWDSSLLNGRLSASTGNLPGLCSHSSSPVPDSGSQEFKNQRVVRGSVRTGDVGRASRPSFLCHQIRAGRPCHPSAQTELRPTAKPCPTYLNSWLLEFKKLPNRMISGNNRGAIASITMPTRAQIEDRMFDRLLPTAVLSRRRANTNQIRKR